MEPIDPQTNGPQLLYGLRYHIHINTAEEAITFHDQVGYWLWEPATGLIMQTIAIPRGQLEAALALGMSKLTALRRIIIPQAIRIVIPSLGNYFIGLFKDTALCSAVSIQEVLFTAQIIAAQSFQYFTLYTIVLIMYLGVSFPAARLVGCLERVTRRGYARKRR